MADTHKKPTKIYLLNFKDIREIEWLFSEFLDKSTRHIILIPDKKYSERAHTLIDIVREMNVEVFTYLEFLFPSMNILSNKTHRNFAKNISAEKRMHSFTRRLILWVLKIQLFKRMRGYGTTFFYVGNKYFSKNRGLIQNIILDLLKRKSIKVGCILISLNDTKIRYPDIGNEASKIDFEYSEIIGGRDRYTDAIKKFFERQVNSSRDAKKILSMAHGRKIAVLFTKNISGYNFLFRDNEIKKYREAILSALQKEGYFVLIKPHPGERNLLIDREGEKKNHAISYLPAQFVTVISDVCIYEMPSNSLYDSIYLGKKPFWPLQLSNEMKNWSSAKRAEIIGSNFTSMLNKYCVLGLPDPNKNNMLPLNKVQQFKSELGL